MLVIIFASVNLTLWVRIYQ